MTTLFQDLGVNNDFLLLEAISGTSKNSLGRSNCVSQEVSLSLLSTVITMGEKFKRAFLGSSGTYLHVLMKG